ncbi:methyl-accepting chemotaxis protein [Thiomicrospira pelophila]|uniref:methyl-accepting chemotaxis protein n=1 Tax=Thiomicrospira pelophila TaxID=934 RepID=UPI0004A713CE|nr:methyl-accepting chemotaxis protein [Thiomicrospira pelophila]
MTSAVTQKEFKLPASMVIVSTTDLHGTILHCNDSFLEAAGLTRSEVIGQPHNILRHPDVPASVFSDLWSSLKAGLPWSQVVKNRRKNGDHYWVRAFATPVRENGQTTGYMSVRFPASADEIQQAERAYQAVSRGVLSLRQGKPNQLWNKLRRYLNPQRVLMLSGAGLLVSLLAGLIWAPSQTYPFSLLFGGLTALTWGWSQARLKNELTQMQTKLVGLASGDVRQDFTIGSGSFFDTLSNWLQPAVVRLGWMAQEAKEAQSKSAAVMKALDSATSCIMLADTDYHIQYANKSLLKIFEGYETQMQQALPKFHTDKVIGSNIDIFHKDPKTIRERLDNLTERMVTELTINELRFRLTITPIRVNKKRQSTMVEWQDITLEHQIQSQLQAVIHDLSLGHFKSIEVSQQADGFYKELQIGINNVISTLHDAMTEITQVVVAQSEGDLTQEVTVEYEGDLGALTQAINASTRKLREIVSEVLDVASHVSEEAHEVSTDAHELSSRVQEQASSLEQTSATMHEMNTAVQNSSQNAMDTEVVAQKVEAQVASGAKVMQQTLEAMTDIQKSSHQIADIVTLIDSIAFQTNLLALNAAVEAARAGDHGRGFAVVAGEVRGLAQKSAEAAKDIRQLINNSVQKIDFGTKLAASASEELAGVSTSIKQVTEMVEQIAQSATEQADGINQVNLAINSIDNVTQQNASLVERTTEASKGLSEQAQKLNHNMSFFKTQTSNQPKLLSNPKRSS